MTEKIPVVLASMGEDFEEVVRIQWINEREFTIYCKTHMKFETITYLFDHNFSITHIYHDGMKLRVTVTPHRFIEEMKKEEDINYD